MTIKVKSDTIKETRGEINRKGDKKMFNEMIDKIINKFGFEAKETIVFCNICEDAERGILTDVDVRQEFNDIMTNGI